MQAGEEALLQGHSQFLLCHGHAAVANRLPADRFIHLKLAEDDLVPVSAPDVAGRPRYSLAMPGAGALPPLAYRDESGLGRRSAERRVGKECFSTCGSGWAPVPS